MPMKSLFASAWTVTAPISGLGAPMFTAIGANTMPACGMSIVPSAPMVAVAGAWVVMPLIWNVGVTNARFTATVTLPALAPAVVVIPGMARLIESATAASDASASPRRRPLLRIAIRP